MSDQTEQESANPTAEAEPRTQSATPVNSGEVEERRRDTGANVEKDGGRQDSADDGDRANLSLVLDIPVQICMELGRTKISIRDLLRLSEGSVVKLERPAGEPLDILVNGCLVARGEVVVANERFGMRITDIVSTEERVRRLQ